MKQILKLTTTFLLVAATALISCSRNPGDYPPSSSLPPSPPSLSGQEFLFDSLTWTFFDGSFDVEVDEIYLQTPPRADLFPRSTYSRYINAQVLIKLDTASNWVET